MTTTSQPAHSSAPVPKPTTPTRSEVTRTPHLMRQIGTQRSPMMTDTIVGWTIVCIALILLAAHYARKADARLTADIDAALATEDDDWLDDYGPRVVYGADELPIFDATVAHISKWAAVDLDREWSELNGGAS